jgi:hypothetical protein
MFTVAGSIGDTDINLGLDINNGFMVYLNASC